MSFNSYSINIKRTKIHFTHARDLLKESHVNFRVEVENLSTVFKITNFKTNAIQLRERNAQLSPPQLGMSLKNQQLFYLVNASYSC